MIKDLHKLKTAMFLRLSKRVSSLCAQACAASSLRHSKPG